MFKRGATEKLEGTRSPTLVQRSLFGRVNWGYGRMGSTGKRAPDQKLLESTRHHVFFSSEVPSRGLDAKGGVTGAVRRTVVRTGGKPI